MKHRPTYRLHKRTSTEYKAACCLVAFANGALIAALAFGFWH